MIPSNLPSKQPVPCSAIFSSFCHQNWPHCTLFSQPFLALSSSRGHSAKAEAPASFWKRAGVCVCVWYCGVCIRGNITVNFNAPQWVQFTLHCSSIRFRLTDSVYTFNNAGQRLMSASLQHQHTLWLHALVPMHAICTQTHTHFNMFLLHTQAVHTCKDTKDGKHTRLSVGLR